MSYENFNSLIVFVACIRLRTVRSKFPAAEMRLLKASMAEKLQDMRAP